MYCCSTYDMLSLTDIPGTTLFGLWFSCDLNQRNPETGQAHADGAGDRRSLPSATGTIVLIVMSYHTKYVSYHVIIS